MDDLEPETDQQYRRLNALVRTQAQRDKIKEALKNNNRKGLDARHDGFQMQGNKVMYQLENGQLVQLLMTSEDVKKQIRTEYNKASNAGKGQDNLYWGLKNQFLGITRAAIVTFLKADENYVLAQATKPRVNKSVVSSVKSPDELWSVDLIEYSEMFHEDNTVDANKDTVSTRRGGRRETKLYRYIFSCMDVFSRKIWLEPMTSKETANHTVQALWSIIQRNDMDTPKSILCDNGTEFQGEFAAYCKLNEIKIRNTRSYAPQGNPVERSNKAVRDTLQKLMIRNKSLKWWDILRDVEDSRNSSYHSVIRASPNQVYAETVDMEKIVKQNKKNAQDKMDKYKATEFQLDDKVFASSSVMYSGVRDKIKAKKSKDIIVKFVPIQFRVSKFIKASDKIVERPRYELREAYYPYRTLCNSKNIENNRKKYTAARIFASDLIECTLTSNRMSISVVQALRMNGVEKRGTDLVLRDLDA